MHNRRNGTPHSCDATPDAEAQGPAQASCWACGSKGERLGVKDGQEATAQGCRQRGGVCVCGGGGGRSKPHLREEACARFNQTRQADLAHQPLRFDLRHHPHVLLGGQHCGTGWRYENMRVSEPARLGRRFWAPTKGRSVCVCVVCVCVGGGGGGGGTHGREAPAAGCPCACGCRQPPQPRGCAPFASDLNSLCTHTSGWRHPLSRHPLSRRQPPTPPGNHLPPQATTQPPSGRLT
jgi:hypothetical protein